MLRDPSHQTSPPSHTHTLAGYSGPPTVVFFHLGSLWMTLNRPGLPAAPNPLASQASHPPVAQYASRAERAGVALPPPPARSSRSPEKRGARTRSLPHASSGERDGAAVGREAARSPHAQAALAGGAAPGRRLLRARSVAAALIGCCSTAAPGFSAFRAGQLLLAVDSDPSLG